MFGRRRDYERIFDGFFNSTPNNPVNYSSTTITERPIENSFFGSSSSAVVVKEENGTRATITLPGVKKENITIKVSNKKRIVVDARIDEKYEKKTHKNHDVKNVNTSFDVPHSFEQEKIEVTLENGVLEIFIPANEKQETDNDYVVKF